MENEYFQLGAVAFIFLFFIIQFFSFLKSRKNGNGSELKLINQKLDNHIKHISTNVQKNEEHIEAMRNDINDIKIELVKITALIKRN